ncbi:MAG: calcium:proton antiporter [Microvirga sp.]
MHAAHARTPVAAMAFPAAALALVAGLGLGAQRLAAAPPWVAEMGVPALATVVLIGAVFAALHHGEGVAARLGEPFGTLVMTIAVTTIEVAIIASLMLHGENNPTLAREAVFSVVMIVCTGAVGLCLLTGALRHYEQDLRPRGTSAFLAALTALSVLTLVLPNYTITTRGPTFSPAQLAFVSVVSVLLYGAFLFVETVRHRSDFLDVRAEAADGGAPETPSNRQALVSLGWLIASLFGVVFLAKKVAAGVEDALDGAGLARPDALVGAVIALLVLLPEIVSAVLAAARNRLQTSLNIALGSALATIGLTIPAVCVVSLLTGRELALGLETRDSVLLFLTLGLSALSFGTGRTNLLTGLVHHVVFATYILLLIAP